MLTYTVNQVENLTGIKAHTLRIWEKRYGIIKAKRSKTNIRYYQDDQLKKLLNISILLKNGYRISQLDSLEESEINQKVTDLLSTNSVEIQDQMQALVLSMLELDENGFNEIFNKSVATHGLENTFLKLIYPFLNLVGGLWTTNNAIPAQEHFISYLIRQKMISAIENLEMAGSSAKKIILCLFESERHELGLLMGHYMAKSAGWRVYYLGQNVPDEDIVKTAQLLDPDGIFSMITTNQPNKTLRSLNSIRNEINTDIYISGNIEQLKPKIENLNIHCLDSPEDFKNLLKG